MKKWFLFILLFTLSSFSYGEQGKFLNPQEAFSLEVFPLEPDRIEVTWDVAKGYYLYRDKIRITSGNNDIAIKNIDFPSTETKDDPTFGKVEIMQGMTYANVLLDRSKSLDATELSLKIRYQGCKDKGICYTPITVTKKVELEAFDPSLSTNNTPEAAQPEKLPTITPLPSTPQASAPFGNLISTAEKTEPNAIQPLSNNVLQAPKTLSVDQAFQFVTNGIDKKTIQAAWQVTPNHHLYKDKISFRLIDSEGVTLGTPKFPKGKVVKDEFFGQMEVYGKDLSINIPLSYIGNVDQVTLETKYQGCSVLTGVCYQPQTQQSVIKLADLKEHVPPPISETVEEEAESNNETVSIFNMDGDIQNMLENTNFFGVLAAFFVGGLFLAFTPCIFPMIPILSGVIAGYDNLSSRKAFLLSLAYVTASAVAYSVIGIVFGSFGSNLQATLQNPIAIGVMVALFVLLSLSMFGFYELQMPTGIQSRLNEISNRQRSGSFIGAAVMGFLSTLIVGPCTGPVIAGALTYIAHTNDALLGGSALFAMGLAMGLPLLIVGTSAGHLLPRAGAWMDTTKAIFGIMMLGMAIWMLDRIVEPEVTMSLTSILLIVSGIYMGGLDRLQEEAGGWRRFWKSIGLIMLIYGVLMLLGVASGSKNLLQPMKGLVGGYSISVPNQLTTSQPNQLPDNPKLEFTLVRNVTELDAKLLQARENQQLSMLKFSADWCSECKRMDKNTFGNDKVKNSLSNVQLLVADVTDNDDPNTQALLKAFGIVGPPTTALFGLDGRENSKYRMVGYVGPEDFLKKFGRFKDN